MVRSELWVLVFEWDEPTMSQQHITIFYNGRISVCDVTEFQARAIIWLASREMEERIKSARSNQAPKPLHSQLYGPPGLSLKRSLQMFLQKRKKRAEAISPYSQL
ncbi:unnamed protein product [Dovyalis caffra]|uniref:Protein TIFY n=1 Tax=Dovyalis caffra TaxID=77055 RepID=A0AAV1RXW4_9ROSI|nr:unnamed protein product [Dovyalis caffra]